jgi:hypothetical protein
MLRCMSLLLARRVISRQRTISVAIGAKRTLSRIGWGLLLPRPSLQHAHSLPDRQSDARPVFDCVIEHCADMRHRWAHPVGDQKTDAHSWQPAISLCTLSRSTATPQSTKPASGWRVIRHLKPSPAKLARQLGCPHLQLSLAAMANNIRLVNELSAKTSTPMRRPCARHVRIGPHLKSFEDR